MVHVTMFMGLTLHLPYAIINVMTQTPDLEFVENLRYIVWQHQQRLLADPDLGDPWAFLIDPSIQLEKAPWG